jgi:Mg2+ and Co2+ transporter CorA
LAAGALGGVFSDVMDFLAAEGDESGLINVLAASSADMVNVEEKLSVFLDNVDATNAVTSSTGVASIKGDTIVPILNLIVNIIASVLNLVLSIITSVLFLITDIAVAVLNLIVQIIVSIISLIVSILNAILGIFGLEANSVSSNTLSILKILAIILGSPVDITEIVVCSLSLPLCPNVSAEELGCKMDALTCQNAALAAAL